MRYILILCGVTLLIGGFVAWRALRAPDTFGAFTGVPQAEVADLIERPAEYLHKTVMIEGVVREQCESMGCFFFFQSAKKQLRIDLADIAMNAPRRNGRRARVEGQMVPYLDGYQLWASGVTFE